MGTTEEVGRQEFKRNETVQVWVQSEINFTHPTHAEQGTHFVTSQLCAGKQSLVIQLPASLRPLNVRPQMHC